MWVLCFILVHILVCFMLEFFLKTCGQMIDGNNPENKYEHRVGTK